MTALSIQIQESYIADICIDPHFEKGYYYKQKLEDLNLFDAIRIVDPKDIINTRIRSENNGFKRKLKLGLLYISNYPKKFLSSEGYDYLFTSTNAFLYTMCSCYLKRRHNNFKTIYFDDGEGSYDDFIKIFNTYHGDKLSIHLYSPDLFKLCYPGIAIQTSRIRRWIEDNKIRDAIEHVFEQKDKAQIAEKYIILDTVKSEAISSEDAKKLDELYHVIATLKGNENVIIKKHPRDTMQDDVLKNYPYTSIPFEYIALESEIDDKVLISLSSTAAVMPKIILDQEPTVILLYKMFKMGIGEDNTREVLYQNCRSMYREKRRFVIPSSKEELIEVLDGI